ncbi:hypothetical protein MP228_010682 [Amoeboaphelidium protococcarum]|nr:hypothetical protein MP228_010682 [Amoeboaphelidium protococcarum]
MNFKLLTLLALSLLASNEIHALPSDSVVQLQRRGLSDMFGGSGRNQQRGGQGYGQEDFGNAFGDYEAGMPSYGGYQQQQQSGGFGSKIKHGLKSMFGGLGGNDQSQGRSMGQYGMKKPGMFDKIKGFFGSDNGGYGNGGARGMGDFGGKQGFGDVEMGGYEGRRRGSMRAGGENGDSDQENGNGFDEAFDYINDDQEML